MDYFRYEFNELYRIWIMVVIYVEKLCWGISYIVIDRPRELHYCSSYCGINLYLLWDYGIELHHQTVARLGWKVRLTLNLRDYVGQPVGRLDLDRWLGCDISLEIRLGYWVGRLVRRADPRGARCVIARGTMPRNHAVRDHAACDWTACGTRPRVVQPGGTRPCGSRPCGT